MLELPARVFKKVAPDPNTGCWLWIGATTGHGYGNIGKPYRSAHRLVYEFYNGPIEAGKQLDHLCRQRCCVNPQHLEPVTALENTRRSPLVGKVPRRHRTTCRRAGHPLAWTSTGSRRVCYECERARKRKTS